ncbi:MAG TPA: family 10 glycosylhydrolase [Gammaproteobacteria bacterium]|nr:family 10 glycosylhydrolase [Gammaproteobacteria bacterium]
MTLSGTHNLMCLICRVVPLHAFLLFLCCSGCAHSQVVLDRDALDYDRRDLTTPELAHKLTMAPKSLGLAGVDGWGVTGWFEYDFTVPQSGWFELTATLAGKYRNIEYIIDPDSGQYPMSGTHLYGTGQGLSGVTDKISNLWLEAGVHVLRLQQYYWTGFPPIIHLAIKSSAPGIAGKVRAVFPERSTVFRMNECPSLEIYYGQLPSEKDITVFVKDASTGKARAEYSVELSDSENLEKQRLPVYCSEPGGYILSFGDRAGRPVSSRDIGHITYEVIDTQPVRKKTGNAKRILIEEINCAVTAPDYSGGGETRVIRETFGSYRESGDAGWRRYQRLAPALRPLSSMPSWFAYELKIDEPQTPYIVEVDYPDDEFRSFAIALRESEPVKYPVAGGVDSGGEFSLSRAMVTQTLIFWPTAKSTRIVFMNARQGSRAAAAKIRVYRVDGGFPPLDIRVDGGRQYANWYEEGGSFTSLYGLPDNHGQMSNAISRWIELAQYMGVNVLYPAVSIYNFNFYPSQYNRAFSAPAGDDTMRRMLLMAEKYGMKLLPDLHPRSDELLWDNAGTGASKANVLVSRDGETINNLPSHYNPVYPDNQEWYVGMIGELVDRYKDSPALLGVSLRVMQWQNPTLNNFHSLEWGYGDYTVGLFQEETGVTVPDGATDSGRFRRRYNWLMANARDQWIDWRCKKITQLYRRIGDRVREARPDLNVYALIFDAYPSEHGIEWMKGAGLDIPGLSEVDGLVLINSLHAYGRLYDDLTTQGTRDNLLDPEILGAMAGQGQNGNVLPYTRYFEATDAVIQPEEIGFDPATKKTWTSAVVNPAGRHYLERFAVTLAETDAAFLGDGGNGFTLGQPLLREFMKDYRALPRKAFYQRKDARDPVAVWELDDEEGYYFYAVNRERFPVKVILVIDGAGDITRMSTGQHLQLEKGDLILQLKPYQLMSFKGAGDARIASVSADIPPEELQRVITQVEWLEALENDVQRNLAADQRQMLMSLATEARRVLDAGRVWQARTLIENHSLLGLYQSIGKYPPELRNTVVNMH